MSNQITSHWKVWAELGDLFIPSTYNQLYDTRRIFFFFKVYFTSMVDFNLIFFWVSLPIASSKYTFFFVLLFQLLAKYCNNKMKLQLNDFVIDR